MKKFTASLIAYILFAQTAWAGLPPTQSKASGDSANKTTFTTNYEDMKATRSGGTASLTNSWNQATNGGAENGSTTGWTVSGTSAVAGDLATDSTNKYEGNFGFAWTPHSADNYLTNTAVVITANQGLSGQNCAATGYFKSSDGTHILEAYDVSTSSVIGSATIPISTNYQALTVNFPCPASSASGISTRINAGSTTVLYFDAHKWGDAKYINLSSYSQASLYGSARWVKTASCSWAASGGSPSNYSADTDCTSPTGSNLTGNATAPATKVPGVAFPSLPSGDYLIFAKGNMQVSATSTVCHWTLSDGTSTDGFASAGRSTADDPRANNLVGRFSYSTPQGSTTFQIQYKVESGAGNCEIDAAANDNRLEFLVYRFPTTTDLGLKPDQSPAFWSGSQAGIASGCSATSTTFVDTSACTSIALTERTNVNFGTVFQAASTLPGIAWTPSKAMSYLVLGSVVLSSSSNTINARLVDGSGNVISPGFSQPTTAGATTISMWGILSASSTAAQTVKVQVASAAGSVTIGASATTGAAAINWTIIALPAGTAPLLVGSVTSNTTGIERIERATIVDGVSASITRQSGSWLSSITAGTTGLATLTVAAGIFSGTPTCVASCDLGSAADRICTAAPASSTSVSVASMTGAGAANTQTMDIVCMGPR